jgi:uncharacterized protein YbjT (DUF2867 family)
MRIVVAGAAGNLGSEIVAALIQTGHRVVALDTMTERLEPLRAQLAGLHAVDLRQPEQIGRLLEAADLVITTVGIGRPGKLSDFREVDYQSNLNLLRAAERQGIQNFIYTSVAGVDTDLAVPLLKAKHDFERKVVNSGLDYLILRPSSYFTDVWRTFMVSAQKGQMTLVGTRQPYYFSPIHPGDVAWFVADNLGLKKTAVSLGGPERFTYAEISNLCFELLGKPPRLQIIPLPLFDGLLTILRLVNPALWSVMRFLRWASTTDLTAPPVGTRTVRAFLSEELKKQAASAGSAA